MARPGRWERFVGEYVNSATSLNHHEVLMATMEEGETLTRIRFQWQAQHAGEFAAHGTGFVVAAGIINLPLTGGFPVPDPAEFPNDPWIWWNGSILQTTISFLGSDENVVNIDSAPRAADEVDVRAQRSASPAGDGIYFSTGTTDLSPTQCDHYLSVTASMFILEAP